MKAPILVAMIAVLVATLACSIFLGGPAYPDAPPSTASPQDLETQILNSIIAAADGTISVNVDEAQLTSFVADELAQQTNPILTDPIVQLRDGQIELYGRAHRGIFLANVRISARAGVDADGQPQIDIVKTDFGPFAAPHGLNEALAVLVREAFTGWLGPVATGFRLESIQIGDGVMTVTGRIN